MSVVSGIGGKLVRGNSRGNSRRTLHPSLKLVTRRTVQIHTIARNFLCGKTPRQEKKCLKRALPTYLRDLCSMMKFMDWIINALHQSHTDEKRFRRDAICSFTGRTKANYRTD